MARRAEVTLAGGVVTSAPGSQVAIGASAIPYHVTALGGKVKLRSGDRTVRLAVGEDVALAATPPAKRR